MLARFLNAAALVALTLAMLTQGQGARALDWTKVPGKDITLFYPAQMSWEMLLTQSEHGGAEKFRDGKNCRGCHEGEEESSGNLLVADKSVEATPIAGKPGSIKLNVKAAHDGERIYIQLAFTPGAQPDAGMDKDFATKVAVMLDDGGVAEAGRAGCWAACHDNATRMPSAAGKETTKYLARSRVSLTRKGGEEIKPAAEIDAMRTAGGFLEYWQARLVAGAPPKVVDGTVLEKRSDREVSAVIAESAESNGLWTVTFSRKLDAGPGYKPMTSGKTYTVGFSVHAGHAAHRFHYVSLERTLTIDAPTPASGKPDFVAAPF
ncbi:MAG: cytochrome c-552 precursor [Rhodospirillaceae bacterium]|nr:cytochrome c-552 precursor [Rhodospirillaceae bacterium]